MEIIEIVERNDDIIYELCLLWERSVRATHHFLNDNGSYFEFYSYTL